MHRDAPQARALVADIVRKNMRTMARIREMVEGRKPVKERVADAITRFTGSITFVWLHVLWFGVWIPLNLGVLPVRPFDPFPFGLLTMIVSLEAIFLSTFVLISQNRAAEEADDRMNLSLQIDLLTERELTKLLCVVESIARKVGAEEGLDREYAEMEEQVRITDLVAEYERTYKKVDEPGAGGPARPADQ